MEAAEIYALYRRADVVVAPSRGEGFGLPIAEALALAKPVITTAFGGQMDFCSAENAWLCDYDFAYARSHLSTPLSVWAEPRLDSLVGCLQQARNASADERRRRGQIGRARVRANYAWKDVAADCRALSPTCGRSMPRAAPAEDRLGFDMEQSLWHCRLFGSAHHGNPGGPTRGIRHL